MRGEVHTGLALQKKKGIYGTTLPYIDTDCIV